GIETSVPVSNKDGCHSAVCSPPPGQRTLPDDLCRGSAHHDKKARKECLSARRLLFRASCRPPQEGRTGSSEDRPSRRDFDATARSAGRKRSVHCYEEL